MSFNWLLFQHLLIESSHPGTSMDTLIEYDGQRKRHPSYFPSVQFPLNVQNLVVLPAYK